MGILAAFWLNYRELFESSNSLKPYDSPWIAAGPVLQIIRGAIISVALWFFKDGFLLGRHGWLKLWGLMVGLSTLSTTGPAPGSVEGFIYTSIPIGDQAKGYLEVVPQTGLFAILVCSWYRKPNLIWNLVSVDMVSLVSFFSIMGVLADNGIIEVG